MLQKLTNYVIKSLCLSISCQIAILSLQFKNGDQRLDVFSPPKGFRTYFKYYTILWQIQIEINKTPKISILTFLQFKSLERRQLFRA